MNLDKFNPIKLNAEIDRLNGELELLKSASSNEAMVAKDVEIADLKQHLSTAVGMKTDYDAQIASLTTSHESALNELKASHKTEMENLVEGHSAALTDLQGQLESTKMSANKEAHKIVAGLGVSVDDLRMPTENNNNNETPESLYAQFSAMKPGKERSAFFNKHKDVLGNYRVPLQTS